MVTKHIIITEQMLASNTKRFVNFLIDETFQYGVMYGLISGYLYYGGYTGNYGPSTILDHLTFTMDMIFSFILLSLYYFIIEVLTSRSLGKYVTKTKVIMHNGQEPTPKAVLIRTLCRSIPFDAISFLGIKGKGWHDSISKTYVVDIAKFEAGRALTNELDQIGQLTEEFY